MEVILTQLNCMYVNLTQIKYNYVGVSYAAKLHVIDS